MIRVFFIAMAMLFSFGAFVSNAQELPKTPTLPISKYQLSEVLSEDSAEKWSELSESAKKKAFEFMAGGKIDDATNWLYTHFAAEMFSKAWAEVPRELKGALLSDMPAFFDFYETISEGDSMTNAATILSDIYRNQPVKCKEFLRSALALSLIYDNPIPAGWPTCNMPDEPTQVSQSQEIFLYYSLRAGKMGVDFKKMTIRELIFVLGIAGPLTELEGVFEEGFAPAKISSVYSSIKIDTKRARRGRSLKWDTEKTPFTLGNIKNLGGTEAERVYYTWRVANANGVPCLYFSEVIRGETYAWLAYLKANGQWETNVFRNPLTKGAYGYPLNPQNWKPVSFFDLKRRNIREKQVYDSIVLARFAKAYFDDGKYASSRDYAKKAIESDAENSLAYSILVPSLARCGAEADKIEVAYKDSVSAFSKYPEMSTKMLNLYRSNLIARGKSKDADKIFAEAMKPIFKNCAGLAVTLYGDVLLDMYSRCQKPAEVMNIYKNVLRFASKVPVECFDYIVEPTANYFWEKNDRKSAFAVLRSFERVAKSSAATSLKFNKLKDDFTEQEKAEKDSKNNKKKKSSEEAEMYL